MTEETSGPRGRIAVLGWGSLIWDPRGLQIDPEWHADGPTLPIEFSRVSGLKKTPPAPYLSLVIDQNQGTPLRVMYAISKHDTIPTARGDLAQREMGNAQHLKFIAQVRPTEKPSAGEAPHFQVIREWAHAKGLQGVIWTDLPPEFPGPAGNAGKAEAKQDFSNAAALAFLETLAPDSAALAWRYIARAPASTETAFRKYIREAHPAPASGPRQYAELEAHLRHKFRNEQLLKEALTHETFVNENRSTGRKSNDRLAFVGDAVLELVVRQRLYARAPELTLGELNVAADEIVENEISLPEISLSIGIPTLLIFGRGEKGDSLRTNPELQATGLEAVIGALYWDAGPTRTFETVSHLLDERDKRIGT